MTPEQRADAICSRYWDAHRGEFWCHRNPMREIIAAAIEAAETEARDQVATMTEPYLIIRTMLPVGDIKALMREIRSPAQPLTEESHA